MKIAITILLAFLSLGIFAQTPDYDFKKTLGSAFDDEGHKIAEDKNGNILIAGSFIDTLEIQGTEIVSYGSNDAFFAKFDSEGLLLWIYAIGGEAGDVAHNISFDSDGNYYFGGSFHSPILYAFDTTIISCGCSEFGFIAKLSPDGDFQWIRGFMGDGAFIMSDLKVNSSDEIIFSGSFYLSAFLSSGTYYSQGVCDIFLVAYSTSGDEIWARTFGGPGMEAISGFDLTSDDQIMASGGFTQTLDMGAGAMVSSGNSDVFVSKLTNTGNIVWSLRAGGSLNDQANTLTLDSEENILISGFFNDTADFSPYEITSSGYEDLFLAKYNSFGEALWVKDYGNGFDEAGLSLETDSENNIYLTGRYMLDFNFGDTVIPGNTYSDILILKWDESGNEIWAKSISGPRNDAGLSLCVISNDVLLITGYFRDSAIFDDGYVYGKGQNEVFFAKLSGSFVEVLSENISNPITIFPNPATELLVIESKYSVVEIQVITNSGQIIITKPIISLHGNELNISDLQKGLYFLKIKTVKGVFIRKIIKN